MSTKQKIYLDLCCLNRPFDAQDQEGIQALMNNLGPADAVRFLRQYDRGYGDYTASRRKLLGRFTRDQILREIRAAKGARRKSVA